MNKEFFIKYAGIIIPTVAVLVAQFLKYIIAKIKKEDDGYAILAGAGRMPSGHASLTTSLLVYIIYRVIAEHADPALMGIALVLWYLTLRDAIGVRREVEKHAIILNRFLLNKENKKIILDEAMLERNKNKEIKNKEEKLEKELLSENQGHTKIEVLGGIVVGIIVPIIYYYLVI